MKEARSLLLMLLLNVLIKPFWILVVDRHAQMDMGLEQFGIYSVLINLSIWFAVILDPGIHSFNNRALASSQVSNWSSSQGVFSIKLLLSILYILFTCFIGILFGYDNQQILLLLTVTLNAVVLSWILFIRSIMGGMLWFGKDSLASIADRLLLIIFSGSLIYFQFPTILTLERYIYAQFFAYLVGFIFLWSILGEGKKAFSWHWDSKQIRSIFKESLPLALLTVLMSLYTRLDMVMIERLLIDGKLQAGIYNSGFRLLDAGTMFAYLFATLLLPITARYAQSDPNKLKQVVKVFSGILFSLIWIVVVCSYLYREPLMKLLYKEQYRIEIAETFGLLIISYLAIGLIYIYGTMLTAIRKTKLLNISSLFGLIMNIVLNLWLIPIYGAKGAVIATLATQFPVALIQTFFAIKYFSLNISVINAVKWMAFITLNLLLSNYFINSSLIIWQLQIMIISVMSISFAILLKLWDIKLLLSSLKQTKRNE